MPVLKLACNALAGATDWSRSTDGSTVVAQVLAGATYITMARDNQTLLALRGDGTVEQPRKSTDGGDTWANLAALPRAASFAGLVHSSGVILVGLVASVGNGAQIARSTDGGVTWSIITVDTRNPNFATIQASFFELLDGTILCRDAAIAPIRVYRSTNQGATWSLSYEAPAGDGITANTGAFGQQGSTVLFIHRSGAVIFGGLRVVRSTNSGATWTSVYAPANSMPGTNGGSGMRNCPAFVSQDSSWIFYTREGGFPPVRHRSLDDGVTWSSDSVNTPPNSAPHVVAASREAIFYQGDSAGPQMFISTNLGATWTAGIGWNRIGSTLTAPPGSADTQPVATGPTGAPPNSRRFKIYLRTRLKMGRRIDPEMLWPLPEAT